MDLGARGAEGGWHPLKEGYDIYRIYKNVQIIKNLSETALHLSILTSVFLK